MTPDELQEDKEDYKALAEKYQLIICNMAGVLFRCAIDEDWTMYYISDYIEKLSGYPASDFMGNKARSFASIMHRNDSIHTEKIVSKAIAEKKSFLIEYRIVDPEGKEIWVFEKGRAEYDENGEPKWLDGIIFSVEDRKKSEDSLLEAKEKNRLILETVKDGILGLDAEGICTFMNPAGLNMLGYLPNEIISKPIHNFLPSIQEGKGESLFYRKDGSSFWVDYAFSSIESENIWTDNVISFNDITERKQFEHELHVKTATANAANRAKSEFLASMSHELRTPLNAILGFSRLLTDDSSLNEAQLKRLGIINRSGEHLLGMVDEILSLSKIEAGRIELKQEAFNVTQMVQDVGQMVKARAEGKGLLFTLEQDVVSPEYVQGDAGKLRQVLINLLSNAVKFTDQGEVSLRANTQSITNDPAMVMLQFEVQDTGPGIPEDQHDRIFESFVQVEQLSQSDKGVGLGLAISKSLVDVMGGQLTVESELGQGALFKLSVPLALSTEQTSVEDEAPRAKVMGLQPGQAEWRILVVDDNPDNRMLLNHILTSIGFSVQEAQNGQEAMDQFQQWAPHFIWMDMRMPVMDGYAATQAIRALPQGRTVKIVAITASVLAEQQDKILDCGCDELIHKPFQEHDIFEAMARHLGVEYLYREAEKEQKRIQQGDLTAEMLAALPAALLTELRATILILDREAGLEVITRIEEQAPETGQCLRDLVENFQMGQISKLLK